MGCLCHRPATGSLRHPVCYPHGVPRWLRRRMGDETGGGSGGRRQESRIKHEKKRRTLSKCRKSYFGTDENQKPGSSEDRVSRRFGIPRADRGRARKNRRANVGGCRGSITSSFAGVPSLIVLRFRILSEPRNVVECLTRFSAAPSGRIPLEI